MGFRGRERGVSVMGVREAIVGVWEGWGMWKGIEGECGQEECGCLMLCGLGSV